MAAQRNILGALENVEGQDLCTGRYRVINKLGAGSFSTVWLCVDNANGRHTAVKALHAYRMVPDFDREFKILEKIHAIDDPSTVRIIRAKSEFVHLSSFGVHYCIALECLGGDLLSLMEITHLPLALVRHMTRHVLEGLNFLHTRCHIVHGDIKPDNILHLGLGNYSPPRTRGMMTRVELDRQRTLQYPKALFKIADFGNAVEITENSRCINQVRAYRAFEKVLGACDNPSVDIWSLGCIVYEAAAGERLFYVTNIQPGADERQLKEFWRKLGEIPEELLHRYGKKVETNHLWAVDIFANLPGLLQQPEEAKLFKQFLMPFFEYKWTSRVKAADCLQAPWLEST